MTLKLTPAQVTALRAIRDDRVHAINARTLSALRNMFAIKQVAGNASSRLAPSFRLTPSGKTYLAEYERNERTRRTDAERAARPVPADAFVEPSAKSAPVMPVEYEDEPGDKIQGVPQAWIDQLVIFLRHGAKIRRVESGWYAEPGNYGFSQNHVPGRLDATVREAIRRGIVRELPPTATGIIRLALVSGVAK